MMPALAADATLSFGLDGVVLQSACSPEQVRVLVTVSDVTTSGHGWRSVRVECNAVPVPVPVNACGDGCTKKVNGQCPDRLPDEIPDTFAQQSRSWWARFTGWLTGSSLKAQLIDMQDGSDCCCKPDAPVPVPVPTPVPDPVPVPTPVPTPIPSPIPTPIPGRLPVPIPPTQKDCGECPTEGGELACSMSPNACEWHPAPLSFLVRVFGGRGGTCEREVPRCATGGIGGHTGLNGGIGNIATNATNGGGQRSSSSSSAASSVRTIDREFAFVMFGLKFAPQCGDGIVQPDRGEQCEPFVSGGLVRCTNTCLLEQCPSGTVRTLEGACDRMPVCPELADVMTPSSLVAACAASCEGFLDSAKCAAACACSCRPDAHPKAGEAAGSCAASCMIGVNARCGGEQGEERTRCCTQACTGNVCLAAEPLEI